MQAFSKLYYCRRVDLKLNLEIVLSLKWMGFLVVSLHSHVETAAGDCFWAYKALYTFLVYIIYNTSCSHVFCLVRLDHKVDGPDTGTALPL